MRTYPRTGPTRRGFTLTELLVVVSLTALLVALLLPSIAGGMTNAKMAKASSNMRNIGVMMGLYSADARDSIVPSQFNHKNDSHRGKARSASSLDEEWRHRGTWTDILWTQQELGVFPEATAVLGHDYRYDSPDKPLYDLVGSFENTLRSPSENTTNVAGGSVAVPYGKGARERAEPGYFAANGFFNDDEESSGYHADGPFTNGQIRIPERSMYLVDSFAGEVIDFGHYCDMEEHT